MKCPNCQKENEPTSHLCAYCGSPLEVSEAKRVEGEGGDETVKPAKKPMSNFRKALIFTSITFIVLGLSSLAGPVLKGFYQAQTVGWLLWIAAIVTAIVFIFKGRRDIASGIFAGIGIGVIALGATCFAAWEYFS